ncbi:ATP-grasp peptide maturase system methyltransferase [Streptomyces sp. NBC_01433]|uniref:ATP-grasp peptide maturase system methyltransferase n=1 Tax=Streptomyces sp. NBC_01433 TaxID=2903864 RepID=UPI002252090F|nr:ATP-grasp peptide maturase system methyltransferase [Streptomyces sp. NBC_01433]MCX4676961.1 ATP-grasp peptide maturase system methyltransferase [Streptomyces sp. NBC_01433]
MSDDDMLRRRLAGRLVNGGHLRTRPWREAVEAVPRHEFLRGGFFERIDGRGPTAWAPVMSYEPGWLERCYEDESLVTQIAGTIAPEDLRGEIMRAPTSSSTMPSLVVRMLEDLDVSEGQRVLEIGTGTGYSSALLCHRLGDSLVTTVEVDEGVSARAGAALGDCGLFPYRVVGDGLEGHMGCAPYDRVIATCGVVTLPYSWIEQTRPGGSVLATVGGWMYSSELARLTVHDDGTASGRFLGGGVSFMLARPQTPPPLGVLPDLDRGDERRTLIGADILGSWNERFVAQLAAARAQYVRLDRNGRTEHVLLDAEAGSWAVLWADGSDGWAVRQGGPDRLWDAVEDHVSRWCADGSPSLERFEINVTPSRQSITWPGRQN